MGAELAILAAVAFLPQRWNVPANLAVSFVCAMQVESFRKIRGNTYATTMCTGNLRSATELLFRCCRSGGRCEREQCLQYYGIILFFAAVRRWARFSAGAWESGPCCWPACCWRRRFC